LRQPRAAEPQLLRLNTVKVNREFNNMSLAFEPIPAQRNIIELDNPREVNWWVKRFGCNEQQLREAVAEVGVSAAKVEQLLDGSDIILTV
jgi:hypothetical protein